MMTEITQDQAQQLGNTLASLLVHLGVVNAIEMTGPELIMAAEGAIESMTKNQNEVVVLRDPITDDLVLGLPDHVIEAMELEEGETLQLTLNAGDLIISRAVAVADTDEAEPDTYGRRS